MAHPEYWCSPAQTIRRVACDLQQFLATRKIAAAASSPPSRRNGSKEHTRRFTRSPARSSSRRRRGRAPTSRAPERPVRRRKIGQIYLYRRNSIRGFYGASEIFLTPVKQRYEISPVQGKTGDFSPPERPATRRCCRKRRRRWRSCRKRSSWWSTTRKRLRRRGIPNVALHRRNLIPLFHGVSEIFQRPRKIPTNLVLPINIWPIYRLLKNGAPRQEAHRVQHGAGVRCRKLE